ncbi:LysR family transcriptional regulator [Sneathiella marina]|uniref:LysR family transcriptional regulator n=1 Tax=Sneathiella marina TaxID=2950108 RepID=A0ABY4W9C7_9PROT|nr:LysR family transcriptional regulator [Sneathiella marina]USG61241.1 LysR family transcriptional regulator [Sneathiella marina]
MIKELDWNLLQSFIAVSEHGSFSAAARATKGSQATYSRHIATLEAQLDSHLFDRANGAAELTQRGMEVLQHALEMADAAGRLSLDIEGRESSLSGTVRVTAITTVSTYILPSILAELRLKEPGIDIELVASNKTDNLLRREADIAIRMYRPTQADLFARKVGETSFDLFAANSYLERNPAPRTADEILNHEFVGFDKSDTIINALKRFGLNVSREFFSCRCDDPIVYWNMIVAGYGIGFNQVEVGESEPKVSRLDVSVKPNPVPMWLAAHSELKTNPRVRRVFDFLAMKLSEIGH